MSDSNEESDHKEETPVLPVNQRVAAKAAAKLLGPLNPSFVPNTQQSQIESVAKRARFADDLKTIPETQVAAVHVQDHDLHFDLTSSQEKDLLTDWNCTQASQITPSPVFGVTATQYRTGTMDLALGNDEGTVRSYVERLVSRFTPAKKGANTKEAFEHIMQASKTKYGAYRQDVTVPGQVTNVHSGKHRQYTVYVTEMIKRAEYPEFMKPTAICRLYKRDTRNAEDIRTILQNLNVETGKIRPEYKKARLQNIYSNFVEAEAVLLGYDFGTCLDAVTKVNKPTLPTTVKTVGEAIDAFQIWAESNDDLDKLTHGAGPAICTMSMLALKDYLSAHLDVKIDGTKPPQASSLDLHDTLNKMSKVIEKLRPADEDTDAESNVGTDQKGTKKRTTTSASTRSRGSARGRNKGPASGVTPASEDILQQLQDLTKTVRQRLTVDAPDGKQAAKLTSTTRSDKKSSLPSEDVDDCMVVGSTSESSSEDEEEDDDDFTTKPVRKPPRRSRLSLHKNGEKKVTSTSKNDGDRSSLSSNDTAEEALNVSTSTVENLMKENKALQKQVDNDRKEREADKEIVERRKAFDTICLRIFEENRRLKKAGLETSDEMKGYEEELQLLCQTEEFAEGIAFEAEVDLFQKATSSTVRPRPCVTTKTYVNKGDPGRKITYVVSYLTVKNEPPSEDEIIVIGDDPDIELNDQVPMVKTEKVDAEDGNQPTNGSRATGTSRSNGRPQNVDASSKPQGRPKSKKEQVEAPTPQNSPVTSPKKKRAKVVQATSHSLEDHPPASGKASSSTSETKKAKGNRVPESDGPTRRSSRRTADREKPDDEDRAKRKR